MRNFNESRNEIISINIFPDNVNYLSFTKPIRALQLVRKFKNRYNMMENN